jgi:ribosomal protein S27E
VDFCENDECVKAVEEWAEGREYVRCHTCDKILLLSDGEDFAFAAHLEFGEVKYVDCLDCAGVSK